MEYDDIQPALMGTGFICRGGFRPDPEDAVPGISSGVSGGNNAVVVIIGNAGSEMWPHFAAATTNEQRAGRPNPLNDWTADVMGPIAEKLGARVHYPFDRPYHPIQRWAMKADTVWQSPLGPLIHPDYGLWHAYRAALVFEHGFDLPNRASQDNPCDACADRKCLKTCPVDAYQGNQYDVPVCVRHIATSEGQTCVDLHCLARRACPVGGPMVYDPAHAQFHMSKFLANAVKRFRIDIPQAAADRMFGDSASAITASSGSA